MVKFQIDDYIASSTGFKSECGTVIEVERNGLDIDDYYTDAYGVSYDSDTRSWFDFDDEDVIYTVRGPYGNLFYLTQNEAMKAVHPMAHLQMEMSL